MYKRKSSGSSNALLNKVDNLRHQPAIPGTDVGNRNMDVIKRALTAVKDLLTPERVEVMAMEGMSQWTICGLYECGVNTINETPELLEAFNKGRANIAKQLRSGLINDALVDNNIGVKLYLDKIYSKEDDTKKVELSVSSRPLENVPTEQLLEIDYEDSDEQE